MLNKIIFSISVLCLIVSQAFSQTESFTISWDLNTESDVSGYQVYRNTSPSASTQIASVTHPDHEYVDSDIEKGVLYYYRLTAGDLSGNRSDYSAEVSAAVPLISGLQSQIVITPGQTRTFQLDDYVSDPDHSDANITWTISGDVSLDVTIANRVATIVAPQNWSGQEQLLFTAEDPDGFSDVFPMTILSENESPPPVTNPPVFVTIPAQQLNEDTQTTLDLADYVSDNDTDISNLNFSVQSVSSIVLSVSGHLLTIRPNSNWNGTRSVNLTVTDNENNSDQIQFNVTVNPVNDAPVLTNLPSQVLKQDTSVVIDLGAFVTDIDNAKSELSWHFTGENIVDLTFNDNTDELTISSQGASAGFDNIIISVADADNASDSDTLQVRVTSNEVHPPQIVNLPDVEFDEDGFAQITLNNYVTDSDDPVENLFWYTGTNENVFVDINSVTNIATISARENWYGETNMWFIVKDPDQNMANDQIKITVNPVNDRPFIQPLPSLNLSEQLSKQLDLAHFSSDVDDDLTDLSWTYITSTDVAVEISPAGVATFVVAESWLGQEKVQFIVTDDDGASDTSETIVYRQNQQFAPQIANIGNFTIPEDGSKIIDLNNYISDPDNSMDQLQITFTNNKNVYLSINSTTYEMTILPAANWNGTEDIFIKAADPDNNVAFDTMSVTVTPVNDAPGFRAIGNLTLLENTTTTLDLSDYIIEADGLDDISEITLLGSNNSFFGYYLDNINYQLTFFSPAGFYGRETYLLKIKDNEQLEASAVFSVQVLEKNIKGAVVVNYFGNETTLNLAWNTITETKDYIEYGSTIQYGFNSNMEDGFSQDHSQLLTGLAEQTEYHFRIVSESTDGNKSFSADSVFVTGTNSGELVNVFPIPYQESKDIDNNGISFTNLPANAMLKIYNLLGEPVYKIDEINSTFRWNVENNAGKKLSSGLYMYVINDQNNKKVTSGKLIVVR